MNGARQNLREAIVDRVLDAAQRAIDEAKFDASDEVGLNEAWVQSFVSVYLNDLLRREFSRDNSGVVDGDVFSIIEKRASWIDRAHCGEIDHRYDISGSRKFDVCLWSNVAAIVLIEIKHNDIALWGKRADLEKIVRSVLRWPKLSFSIFLFSARVPPDEVLRDISSPDAKLLAFLDENWFANYSLTLQSRSFDHQSDVFWHAVTASRR